MNRPHVMSADTAAQALCRDNPEDMFALGAAQNDIKAICQPCPIRTECLATALDGHYEFGIWGGMTERERRALLRRRPHVRDWHRLLTQARSAYSCQSLPGTTRA